MGLFKAKQSEEEKRLSHLVIEGLALNASNELIGHGSSASVYKYTLRGKTAAAKQFKCHLSRKTLAKAASTILGLRNEHICRLRGLSYRPPVLLYEYCSLQLEGETLHNLKELLSMFNDNQHFDYNQRIEFCLQIADGLNFMHHNGVIHRDVKPSNILVTGTNNKVLLKIADFNEVSNFKTLASISSTNVSLRGKNHS